MNKNIDLVNYYFELSNNSNIWEIEKLFTKSSTYNSKNTGLYLWVGNIIKMQKEFHWWFKKLNWEIIEIKEIKENIVKIDFKFDWIKKSWENILWWWIETIIVFENKIQHIEIN